MATLPFSKTSTSKEVRIDVSRRWLEHYVPVEYQNEESSKMGSTVFCTTTDSLTFC